VLHKATSTVTLAATTGPYHDQTCGLMLLEFALLSVFDSRGGKCVPSVLKCVLFVRRKCVLFVLKICSLCAKNVFSV
jgi:hypothetical protein